MRPRKDTKMDNNITIQNTISIGIEIPPETFINEKTINVQNLIIESSSTNNGTICIPDNVSNNIVVPSKKKKIFIVHGHDNEVKLEVARFIEKIGLEPIILHEQVNSGMTVIEKIEKYSDVEFGIVLYTPCDLGYVKGKKKEKKARARQNVVFEHGYLIGKLGRNNVCALVKGDIELPNDISGIVYIQLVSKRTKAMYLKPLKRRNLSMAMILPFIIMERITRNVLPMCCVT